MKEILITKGYTVFVDDEDFERISSHKWRAKVKKSTVYASRQEWNAGKPYDVMMHREILGLGPLKVDDIHVDHKDHNGLNNCKLNLRKCTLQQSAMNRRKRPNASAKYKGMCLVDGKWKVTVWKGGEQYHGGLFVSQEQAALEYNKLATKLHGEYACLNQL